MKLTWQEKMPKTPEHGSIAKFNLHLTMKWKACDEAVNWTIFQRKPTFGDIRHHRLNKLIYEYFEQIWWAFTNRFLEQLPHISFKQITRIIYNTFMYQRQFLTPISIQQSGGNIKYKHQEDETIYFIYLFYFFIYHSRLS